MGKEEVENIERLEMMEERFGVSIEGVFAEYETLDCGSNYLYVRGEIQAVNGTKLEKSLFVVITAYNAKGQVIATESNYFSADDFFGLSPIDICADIIEKPVKIRIYPKNF